MIQPTTPRAKLFPLRTSERNPRVIYRTADKSGNETTDMKTASGWHYRVMPGNGREVQALRMLDHGVDKFAPASGHGVIITKAALDAMDA